MADLLIPMWGRLEQSQRAAADASLVSNGTRHNVRLIAGATPDAVLTQQMRMVGFFLRTGTSGMSDVPLDPVPRSVKDAFRSF